MTKRSDQVGWLPWLIAVFLFPAGLFVLLASARAISWFRAVVFFVLTYGSITGFAFLMGQLERAGASEKDRFLGLLAGFVIMAVWARCAYVQGRRAAFWSRAHRRGWRCLGRFAYGLMIFLVLSNALRLLAEVMIKPLP